MLRSNRLLRVLLIIVAVGVATAALALSGEEAAGQRAEQAGDLRQAVTYYVAALRTAPNGSAADQRLRETIIKLVLTLNPPPIIPEEAERFGARGSVAFELGAQEVASARTPEDLARAKARFDQAAEEFKNAVRAAPWWPEGYFNLASAQEGAGKYADAMRSLKLYLLSAPNAADAKNVQTQIYRLEFKQEDAATQRQAEAQRVEASLRTVGRSA